MRMQYKGKKVVGKGGVQQALRLQDRVQLLQGAVSEFTTSMVRQLVSEILSEEIRQLCGEEYEHNEERRYTRHGQQAGVVTVLGQKTKVSRPRARSMDGKEAELTSYQFLKDPKAFQQPVVTAMLSGVSTRNYKKVSEALTNSCGVHRSTVSRAFVAGSQATVDKFSSRRFDHLRFVALVIDGIEFEDTTFVVAVGIDSEGNKVICGVKEGGTENSTVVKSLLVDLRERGVATDRVMLFIIDGSKALAKGIKEVFGELGLIQRCLVHKKRNIRAHLPERYWAELDKRLSCAWDEGITYAAALKSLKTTVKWLERINPDAAASLEEGMIDTITLNHLDVKGLLRKSLLSTNIIESAFSTVRSQSRRVKRWREGSMRRRWCIAGLLTAEQSFKRVRGYAEIPALLTRLEIISMKDFVDQTKKAA